MEYVELSNVADIISGYAIPSADMVEEGTPIIKITNIKEDGSLDLEHTAKYNKPITPKLLKFILKDKDIVVCMTGATIGKVARILKADQKYIVNQRVCIIRAKNSNLQDFVYHTLTLPTFRKYVEVVGYGAAQPNISAASIGKYKIHSSGVLLTQQKIASILSTYDTLIENNTKRIRLLEQMAENLYKEWFVRFRFPGHENVEMENGLPKGWKIEKLEMILDIKYGKDHKNIEEGNIPILGSGGIMRYGNKALYSGESVLIPRKGSLNNIMYIDDSFWTVDTMFYTVPKIEYVCRYMYFVLSQINMESLNPGAALPSMTTNILNRLKILLPSQKALKEFEKILSPIYCEIKSLELQSTLLTRQRDLLLPRLMSGKLEVTV